MRRIVSLTLAVLLIGVAAFGIVGTSATFTDEEAVPFGASALDESIDIGLDAGVENPIGSGIPRVYDVYDDERELPGVTLNVDGLWPGAWSSGYIINIRNVTGAPDADYTVWSNLLASDPDPGFWDKLQVQVETGDCEVGGENLTISSPSNVYVGLLKNLSFSNATVLENVAGNYVHCYRYAFRLAPDATDALFGGSAGFEIRVHATPAS